MINVKLDVENYCNDCPFFEAETFHARNSEGTHLIYISCENKVSCSRLVQYLDSRAKRKGNSDDN